MKFLPVILVLALAGLACADTGGEIADGINNVICLFVRLIWLVTGSLMALVIIFAGVKWLVSGDDAGARASAKTFIISAFVGLIIIFTAVPVVDYVVGGILGYEFACGFFPEDISPDFLNEEGTGPSGDDRFVVQSVNPLVPSGGAVLGFKDVSYGFSGSGGLFACFKVSNTGGYPADISDLAADLYGSVSLVSSGDCSCGEDLLGAGDSVNVVCGMGSGLPEDVRSDPGSYELYVRAGGTESSYGLNELAADPDCTGTVPEEKLYVQSSDERPDARINAGDGFSDSADVVLGSGKTVILHTDFRGGLSTYSWSIDGVTIPEHLVDKFNKQAVPLNSDEIKAVFKDPGSYTIRATVVGTESQTTYIADPVTLNVLSPADARAGLTKWGDPKKFPKKVDVALGSTDVVLLYAVWEGEERLGYRWIFPWTFTGRDLVEDDMENTQAVPLNKDALPKEQGEYTVTLEVTLDGKTYEDTVTINVREEDYVPPGADAKIGPIDKPASTFKDTVEYVIGSGGTVLLYADRIQGSRTLTYEWTFPWTFKGRDGINDDVESGQVVPLPAGVLPSTPGTYRISFTLTDDYGAVYEEDVWIKAVTETIEQRIAKRIHYYVNLERTSRGLVALNWDNRLAAIASGHSREMAAYHYLSHTSSRTGSFSSRYSAAGYSCRVSTGGENILYNGPQYRDQLEEAHIDAVAKYSVQEQWMKSSGHRANILRPFWINEGIGVAFGRHPSANYPVVYATQNFC